MFDYDKESRDAAATLDKYDLSEQLELCIKRGYTDSWDIREWIAGLSNDEAKLAIEDLTMDEFMEYLTSRYGAYWSDEIRYYVHFKDSIVKRQEELGTKG